MRSTWPPSGVDAPLQIRRSHKRPIGGVLKLKTRCQLELSWFGSRRYLHFQSIPSSVLWLSVLGCKFLSIFLWQPLQCSVVVDDEFEVVVSFKKGFFGRTFFCKNFMKFEAMLTHRCARPFSDMKKFTRTDTGVLVVCRFSFVQSGSGPAHGPLRPGSAMGVCACGSDRLSKLIALRSVVWRSA